MNEVQYRPDRTSRASRLRGVWYGKKVKSLMLMSLYVRIILETLLQHFNNFQCHTPIMKDRRCYEDK